MLMSFPIPLFLTLLTLRKEKFSDRAPLIVARCKAGDARFRFAPPRCGHKIEGPAYETFRQHQTRCDHRLQRSVLRNLPP